MQLVKKISMAIVSLIVLMLIPLVFSGCGAKLTAPENIEYDGTRITWDKVEKAEYYYVSINGAEKKRTNTNSYAYTANMEDFSVTIYAVEGDNEKEAKVDFTALQTIGALNVTEDGTIYWDEVSGADAYVIGLNGASNSVVVNRNEYKPQSGQTTRVKVRPIVKDNSGYYSMFGAEKTVYVYAAPSHLKIEDGSVTWGGNSNQYEVIINGESKGVVSGTSYSLGDTRGRLEVEVRAIGDHSSTFDSEKSKVTYTFLENVTSFQVENGVLSWTPVADAQGYEIKINDVLSSQVLSTYKYENLPSGEQLRIRIRPWASGNFYAQWSDEQKICILDAPVLKWDSSIELDGEARNNLSWDSVSELAAGYEVKVVKGSDESTSTVTNETFAYAYTEEGEYKVSVKTKAKVGKEGYVYYDSRYSNAATIIRLSAPKASAADFITSNHDDVTKGFRINYRPAANATGYQLYLDNSKVEGAYTTLNTIAVSNVGDSTKTSEQTFNYLVKSVGVAKTVNGSVYVTLDSLTSKSLKAEVTVLATPTNLAMDVGSTIANWSDVANANDYIVSYDGSTFISNASQYDLAGLTAGDHQVAVSARGDGGSVLPSYPTSAIDIYKLSAPHNLRLVRESNYQLKFDHDVYAKETGYKVFVGTSSEALSEESASELYSLISTTGTNVSVQSVANYFDDTAKKYFMTSNKSQGKMFTKLEAPRFTENSIRNSDLLTWEAPSNLSLSSYTPTYDVWQGNILLGTVNASKYDISSLVGSTTKYAFKVRAHGYKVSELSEFVDSEISVVKEFYKLQTPSITIENDKYNWSYVANASAYQLRIDNDLASDQKMVNGQTAYSFAPSFTTTGKHSVKLIAVGDGVNSVNSAPFELEQVVAKLSTPEFTYKYTDDYQAKGGKIEVTITSAVPNCKNYAYSIAGTRIDSSELSCSKQVESAGKYYVSVTALGGTFDSDGKYYISSAIAGGTDVAIEILGYPSKSTFTINTYGIISWQTVSNCSGYEYQIAYNGGEYSAAQTVQSSSIEIANYTTYTKISIKVRAKGDGSNVIGSAWTEWSWNNTNA